MLPNVPMKTLRRHTQTLLKLGFSRRRGLMSPSTLIFWQGTLLSLLLTLTLLAIIQNIFFSSMKNFHWLGEDRSIAKFLLPEGDTVLLEPTDCGTRRIKLFVIVPSSPGNWRHRSVVRTTWGRQLLNNKDIRLAFIMGRYSSDFSIPHNSPLVAQNGSILSELVVEDAVFEEGKKYGDIILEDFVDSYLNLSIKSAFYFKWLNKNCPQAEYVFKVDDNVYVNHENLLSLLDVVQPFRKQIIYQDENDNNISERIDYAFLGHVWDKANPNRDSSSKYYMPYKLYAEFELPTFVRGLAYLFTGSLIPALFSCISRSDYIPGEDILVSAMCATNQLGLRLTHHHGFWRYSPDIESDSVCVFKEAVAVHDFCPEKIEEMFNILQDETVCTNTNSLFEHNRPGTFL